MKESRILLVLTGDAFRHVNGRPYIDPENFNDQKISTYSQLRFLQSIRPVEADVFINTYNVTPEYDEALKSWYPNIVRYTAHPNLLGEYGLIDNTTAQLREMDLSPYRGVLFIRIDLFVREFFLSRFRADEDAIMYAHLDSNEPAGQVGRYPGICHNIAYVPNQFFDLLLRGVAWRRHESANLAAPYTKSIRFYLNTYHSCNTAHEFNPLYAMAGRSEPQILWCGPHNNYRGIRFNWVLFTKFKLPQDTVFDYLTTRDCRVHWKSNPEALLKPKKRVVIYANCQGSALRDILAYHSDLADEYDMFGAKCISNYTYMNTNAGLPYNILGEADLFIYQPISSERGQYSTQELLKTLKPGCKTVAFPYLYNYAFWEVLSMSDADYDIGVFGMKYAHLNQKPITDLRDAGVPFEEVERRIRENAVDWKFAERYETTQAILCEKEKDCDVKVADFIDAHHKDHLLFHTQNHPSMFFLRFVAQEILRVLDYDPAKLPEESNLLNPDYNTGHSTGLHYEIGIAAWEHFGFRFIPRPSPQVMDKIVAMSERVYNGLGVNAKGVSML